MKEEIKIKEIEKYIEYGIQHLLLIRDNVKVIDPMDYRLLVRNIETIMELVNVINNHCGIEGNIDEINIKQEIRELRVKILLDLRDDDLISID
jgi:hypothetical protein